MKIRKIPDAGVVTPEFGLVPPIYLPPRATRKVARAPRRSRGGA